MSLHLTEEQRQEVRRANREPVRLTDPETQQEYVLLRAEAYERLKSLVYDDSDFEPARGYALATRS